MSTHNLDEASALLAGKKGIILQSDLLNSALISEVLQLKGCEGNILTFLNNFEAMDQLRKQSALDFLILHTENLDLIAPFSEKFPKLAIILTTSQDIHDIPKNPAIDKIITEPFDVEQLCHEVAQCIKNKKSPRYFNSSV